ncbi:hypothetical protein AMTRI_Chr13g119580 [Amborella trichopoda]
MLMGEGMEKTVTTKSRNMVDGFSTYNSSTLFLKLKCIPRNFMICIATVFGEGFIARDFTVINTAGPTKHQVVALHVQSNFAAFLWVNISAYQNTLCAHSLHQFYKDCRIYDTVDFILGNVATIFQSCQIFAR